MKSFRLLALLLPFATGFTQLPAATVIRDQGQIFKTGGNIQLGTDRWSQSITTGIAGRLCAIQFQIEWITTASLPEVFYLAILDGGNPLTGLVLHSEQINILPSDLDSFGVYTWSLGQAGPFFSVGEIFTFDFGTKQPGFVLAGNDGPGYPGGELFRNGVTLPDAETNDLAFITYVPEPSTSVFAVLSLSVFLLRRKGPRNQ